MTDCLESSVLIKLNAILPLVQRQSSLQPGYKKLHQAILQNFAIHGVPPLRDKMQELCAQQLVHQTLDQALQVLQTKDLIVLQAEKIMSAYPFSLAPTPHQICINNHQLYAVCGFDAVGISAVFAYPVRIISSCALTKRKIVISIDGLSIVTCNSPQAMVGIHWQQIQGSAAQSLCQGMVFLSDRAVAKEWGAARNAVTLLTVEQAIYISKSYFAPLMDDSC